MDIHMYIYIYLCGYNYLTIWDVHIISKVTRDSIKTEVQPLNGTSARFVGSNLWHSLPISKPKQGLLSLLYQIWGFQCDIFFEKKTPVHHQQLIGLKPVDYDEFFGAPQYGHQPSLAMGTTLNQHGRRSKATVDQKYPLPIGSMVLVYMLTLGVYWW